MTFGEYLKYKRKVNKLTQQDIANKLNISDKTVSKWERDICIPDIEYIKELANILHTSIFELVNHEDYDKYSNYELNRLKSKKDINNKKIVNYLIIIILVISIFFNLYLYFNNHSRIYYILNNNINGLFIEDRVNTLYLSNIKIKNIKEDDINTYELIIYQDDIVIYNYIDDINNIYDYLSNINLKVRLKNDSKNIKIIIEFDNKKVDSINYDISLKKY